MSAVLLIALAAACRRRARGERLLLLYAAMSYGAWLLVRQNPDRFLLPGAAAACVAACGVFRCGAGLPVRVAGGGVLAIGIAATFLSVGKDLAVLAVQPHGFWNEMADGQLPDAYLQPVWKMSEHGRVLVLFDAQGRWYPPGSDFNTVWDVPEWAPILDASGTGLEFAARLRAAGYHGVAANEAEFGRLVDFYGAYKGGPVRGRAGIRSPEWQAIAAEFPPYRFAGFGPRELSVLEEFLRLCRGRSVINLPAGPASEFWAATIPSQVLQ